MRNSGMVIGLVFISISVLSLFQNCAPNSSPATPQTANASSSSSAPSSAVNTLTIPFTAGPGGAVWSQTVQFNSDGTQTVNVSFVQYLLTVPSRSYPTVSVQPGTCAIQDMNGVLESSQIGVVIETLACNTNGGGYFMHRTMANGKWSPWIDHGQFTNQ